MRAWPIVYGISWLALAATAALADSGSGSAVRRLAFNRDIRPILSDNCLYCHGPDKNHRKAKLRLDDADCATALKAVVAGQPDKSELIQRIFSDDPKEVMPPPATHKTLSAAQKQTLRQWIVEGAVYEPHWAYITPRRPGVPAVQEPDWVRNPIDTFVLSNLESHHLKPSAEADRSTLLRRLSLDLTGLPPTPAEVAAFVADPSKDAYEKRVDRLLASPAYGERMAVPWLDTVRFADTVGFHGDQNQNVFPYRDYVIDSFNANKPFDQFTIEQLAGDLLPNPTPEQLTATGFNRLNMMTREGGAQAKEYLAKYTADRVRTVAATWLGSTMNCCECHDHKYDPFSTRDFYSLGAFWADVKQWGIYSDYGYTPNTELKGFDNEHPFPPEIIVDSRYLHAQLDRSKAALAVATNEIAAKVNHDPSLSARFAEWRLQTTHFLEEYGSGWITLTCSGGACLPEKGGAAKAAKNQMLPYGEVRFVSKPGMTDRLEFDVPAGPISAIRLSAIPVSGKGITRNAASAVVKLSATVKHKKGGATRLTFDHADAPLKDEVYQNGYALIGVAREWKTSAAHSQDEQQAAYILDHPIDVQDGDVLVLDLPKNELAAVRVAVSPIAQLGADPGNHAYCFLDGALSDGSSADVALAFVLSTGADPAAVEQVRQLQAKVLECRDGKSPTLVTVAWEPMVQRVLRRGNWQDDGGPLVEPAVPHFLPQPSDAGKRRLTRLDLAHWLVSPENPLPSRAVMNRLFKQFFGNGLSNIVEDLGSQGEWPSHPELLDWLAVEFREPSQLADHPHAWDVKHMVRLIVTSAAYRQQSSLRRELADIDPNNRLLASQNPRRLEAEFVRDNALFIAGLLNQDLGGPSAFPYQPQGYYANIQFPNRDWIADPGELQYRRGLYTHWQRTFLHPMLANFDAPSREDANCTRNVSNTPQQALTLLNDPTFVEAARVLAEKAMCAASEDGARLAWIYSRALGRLPKAQEVELLRKFIADTQAAYHDHAADADKLDHVGQAAVPAGVDAVELATWTNVCRVVLNLHETITRY